jgi:hypothetical protein
MAVWAIPAAAKPVVPLLHAVLRVESAFRRQLSQLPPRSLLFFLPVVRQAAEG